MQKYTDTIFNRAGKPIAGAVITVKTYPAGAAATIYATDGGAAVPSVTTDRDGRFAFYAADGHYSLTVSGNGIASYTLADIVLNDPSNDPAVSTPIGITPQDKGAKGDGVTVDTAAFAAWSAAVALTGLGFIPAGVYNLPAGFAAPANATVICAPGAILDISGGVDLAVGVSCFGSVGTAYPITAAPAIGAATLTLSPTDAANFAADDYAEIYSDDIADIAARTDTPIGEIVKVSAVASGTVTLYGALRLPNQYLTNPKLRKITFFHGLDWYGGEIRGRTTGTDPAQIGFYTKYARNVTTHGVFTNKTMGIGHLFESSLNCWANEARSVDNRRAFSGYSVAVGYTAQFCGGRNGDFVRSRHAFTTTGGTSGHGVPLDCGMYNCRSRFATGDDYDTHSIGINLAILDCVSEYCGGSAVNIECQSATVRVKAVKPAQHAVAISNYARAQGNYDLDIEVQDATLSILRLDPGTLPASQYGIKRLSAILNGNATAAAVDIQWGSVAPAKANNIKLAGNVTSAISGNAALLSYCQDIDVSGLKVTCTNTSASAFKFDRCDGAYAVGAQGDLPAASSGASFFVNVSNNVDLRGTHGRSPSAVNSKGITVDSSSSNCQFGDIAANRFIGHTTALSASTGTGHNGSVTGSVVYDPPSLAAGATQQTSVTVSGANVGDRAAVTFSVASTSIRWSGEVTTANNVTVTQENVGTIAIDLASGTLRALVEKLG